MSVVAAEELSTYQRWALGPNDSFHDIRVHKIEPLLYRWLDESAAFNANLICGEAAANAERNGDGHYQVEISIADCPARLIIRVIDSNVHEPVKQPVVMPDEYAEHARGLPMMSRIAQEAGFDLLVSLESGHNLVVLSCPVSLANQQGDIIQQAFAA